MLYIAKKKASSEGIKVDLYVYTHVNSAYAYTIML